MPPSSKLGIGCDADRLAEAGVRGLIGQLHLGPMLDRSLTELLACDATAKLVIRSNGRPVNLGRSTPVIPRWLRRLVQHRDGGCRFCGSTINLDVHHIVHWANGGPTDEINLVTLCSRHHHAVHGGEFKIVGNPTNVGLASGSASERLKFLNPRGIEIGPTHVPKPPDATAATRYSPASGERLQPWAVWFAPNKPNLN